MYASGPGCNTRGLTSLGAYVISQMIKQHFLIQLDHMDSKTATTALAIAQAAAELRRPARLSADLTVAGL